MKIDEHKKAKPRFKGKEVKTQYDEKRERERLAATIKRLHRG